MLHRHIALALLGLSSLLAACSATSQGSACRVGADCASGICRSDGTCADPQPQDDASTPDTGVGVDGGNDATPSFDAGGCVANNDGTILAAEVPLIAGLKATFRVGTNVSNVSTAGQTQPDTSRIWDLTAALSGDHARAVTTDSVVGAWYAASYAGATYATRLSESSDVLGIFEKSNNTLSLLGVVSPADGVTATKVTYNPAAVTLQFPMTMGSTWTTTSTITGNVSGIASYYTEQYASQVDAKGLLKTPFGDFKVLRVRTVLTRTVGVVPTVTRTFAFVAECFGTVATITSNSNETTVEFTTAAEVSRLSP